MVTTTVSGNTQPTTDTGTGTILEALFESTAKTYTLLRIVFLLLRIYTDIKANRAMLK